VTCFYFQHHISTRKIIVKRIFLALFISLFVLTACSNSAKPSTPTTVPIVVPTNRPTAAPTQVPPSPSPTPKPEIDFKVVTEANPQASAKTDVYLQDVKTGEKKLFATLDNVYRDHYHATEYHNGHVYIILRKGDPGKDANWIDELWLYDSAGQGVLLYSVQGLDFRTAPDESYTAIPFSNTDSNGVTLSKVAFIDQQGKVVQEIKYTPDGDNNDYYTQSGAWSNNSQDYWDIAGIAATRVYAFNINVTSWKMQIYPLEQLKLGSEEALNADLGKFVYSDHPIFFDADSAQKFENSQTKVTLFVYDFKSQTSTSIATSIAKKFEPKWLPDNSIEYNDPNGTGRLVYKLP
jgi:hypothetical protein